MRYVTSAFIHHVIGILFWDCPSGQFQLMVYFGSFTFGGGVFGILPIICL